LVDHPCRGIFSVLEVEQLQVLEDAVVPPCGEAEEDVIASDKINAGLVRGWPAREDLMQPWHLEAVREKAALFQAAEIGFDAGPFRDDHDRRLLFRFGMRNGLVGPDYLVDRGGRKLLELKFKHWPQLIRFALGKLNHPEIDVIRRQPCDIQAGPPKIAPATPDGAWGERFALLKVVMGRERHIAVGDGKSPEAAAGRNVLGNVAAVPPGR
jgi:hypothetical protein